MLKPLKDKVEKSEEQWGRRWESLTAKLSNVSKHSSRALSLLNGMIGDYLAEKNLPMAVQMAFYYQGAVVDMSPQGIHSVYPQASDRICILVHGLGCNEQVWHMSRSSSETYATKLAAAYGYTPMYVRYNTGLHISHNGQMLADMLTRLVEVYPLPIREILLINHSMGGLVARSACYYGEQQQASWIAKVRQLYFIGSPLLGADLEKIGHVVATALSAAPLPYTRLVGDILNIRSSGIKDLRFGYVTDEEWQNEDPDSILNNNRQTVPLLESAEHFVITGTVHKDSNHILSHLFGDALVRKYSATGQSSNHAHRLPFLPENQCEFSNLMHVKLAHSELVYQQIEAWVGRDIDAGWVDKP